VVRIFRGYQTLFFAPVVKNVLKTLPCSVLQHFAKKSHFFKNSFKYLLTNKCFNCIVRLMNDPLRPCRTGRSERKGSPESFRGSAPLIFLPSFRWAGLPRHSRLVRRSRSGEGGCGDGGSHRVAVSRSDVQNGLGKVSNQFWTTTGLNCSAEFKVIQSVSK
jgi:hypothetical protein